mgnify:CR=1 FL=1
MDAIGEIATFSAKVILVTLATLLITAAMGRVVAMRRQRGERLTVKRLNSRFEELAEPLYHATLPPRIYRKFRKNRTRVEQLVRFSDRPRVWVLTFEGDTAASQVSALRDEVTAVLMVCREGDEALLRVTSPGGTVVGYGLAASQVERLKRAGLRVTVSIDTVAASGGYMMACVADHIIAAPFAAVGSIGVVAMIPNVRRLLDDKGVQVHEFTAGRYKRTVTPFSEPDDERREKLTEQLEDAHRLFKSHVSTWRPALDVDAVATGEHWYGSRALELGLVDEIRTSDDWLLARAPEAELLQLRYEQNLSPFDQLSAAVAAGVRAVTPGRSLHDTMRPPYV